MISEDAVVLIHKQDRINYVLDMIADYYGIKREQIGEYHKRPMHDRKRFAVKILFEVADCSYREIAEAMGVKGDNSLWYARQTINEDLNATYGNKELKEEYQKLLKFLRL